MDKRTLNQLKENIEKIIKWLMDNADENESVYVEYNYDKRDSKYKDHIYIHPHKDNLIPETGNLWGYHTTYKLLNKCEDYEMLEIVTQWKEIKDAFIKEKQKVIERKNKLNNAIFNFQV